MADIVLDRVTKAFGEKVVLREFSAVFPAGRLSCVMAPSGAGKTTLLRLLMGLERPDAGSISGLEGVKISAVFQEDRLCENLTPAGNIALVNPAPGKPYVAEALRAFALEGCETQPCRELSGGMRRRVALLRALLADYDVLLLDEPFKGLDADTKALVLRETRKRCAGRTAVLVTHAAEEADALDAVRIIRLSDLAGI